jgi:DNA-binding MarR family transcriptional regulator
MSSERFERYVVIAQRFGARTVLFQEAAARHLDLTATQLECFQLVRHEGPMTASGLALETGLTPAALSTIVDKLVAGAFLLRDQDQTDRRRWILQVHPTAIKRVDAVYTTHASRTAALLDDYSDEDLDAALRFMERLAEELKLTTLELIESRPAREGAQGSR